MSQPQGPETHLQRGSIGYFFGSVTSIHTERQPNNSAVVTHNMYGFSKNMTLVIVCFTTLAERHTIMTIFENLAQLANLYYF